MLLNVENLLGGIDKLEAKLERFPGQLTRACVELAKDWRTDRYLRRLEAMLLVADRSSIFTVTGVGDVLEPEHGVAAVGSGGNFALSAARALIDNTDMDAEAIARKAMKIAAEVCVYTNDRLPAKMLRGAGLRIAQGLLPLRKGIARHLTARA